MSGERPEVARYTCAVSMHVWSVLYSRQARTEECAKQAPHRQDCMRIAIDYTPAIAQGAGIGRYTRNLVAALARVDGDDRFTLFSSEPPTTERGFPNASNMQPHVVELGNRRLTIAWHRLRLPIPAELLMGNAD